MNKFLTLSLSDVGRVYHANKCKNANNFCHFSINEQDISCSVELSITSGSQMLVVLIVLINVKMATIVAILTLMSRIVRAQLS